MESAGIWNQKWSMRKKFMFCRTEGSEVRGPANRCHPGAELGLPSIPSLPPEWRRKVKTFPSPLGTVFVLPRSQRNTGRNGIKNQTKLLHGLNPRFLQLPQKHRMWNSGNSLTLQTLPFEVVHILQS